MFTKIFHFLNRITSQGAVHTCYSQKDDPDIAIAQKAQWDSELVPLLSHRNGYVREAALLRAGKLLLPYVLPHLMPRVNDWVPQVRAAAVIAVKGYIAADRFDDILKALPAVYWLRKCSRTNHEDLIERVEQFLAQHGRKEEIPLRIGRVSSEIHVRSMFDLSWKYHLGGKLQLINYGLQSSDWPTLLKACRAIDQLPVAERLFFGKLMLQKKTGWLQAEGLRLVSLNEPSAAKEAAMPRLMSRYAPLRMLAEKISGLTREELSHLRRETLRDTQKPASSLLVAISLSGSLKDKTCEAAVESFIGHVNPALHGAAILALTRISPEEYNSPLVLAALDDPESAVTCNAAKAFLELNLTMLPAEWGCRVSNTLSENHCRRIVALARKTNKWDYLGVLLEYSARKKFPDIISLEMQLWRSQFNRSFVSAKPEQRDWISRNLALYQEKSPSASDIAFYCR